MKNYSKFNFTEIEEKIGYTFNNKALLMQAFTRSSYAKENSCIESNEVLEFIGDSILGMIVTKKLCERYRLGKIHNDNYLCELNEAELSEYKISLVERASLSLAIEAIELEKHLIMSNGDIANNVQNEASVKEDLLEAILGAIAIDSNWNMTAMEKTIKALIDIDARLECGRANDPDYESQLYTKFENTISFEETPTICDTLEYGCSVTFGDKLLGDTFYGYGNTISGARRMASKRALKASIEISSRSDIIKKAVGTPDRERAINQLQELYQKKIIPEPKYIFTQERTGADGNPEWSCACTIEGIYEPNGTYIAASKNQAKKLAAFEALHSLLGNNISETFIKFGKIKEN